LTAIVLTGLLSPRLLGQTEFARAGHLPRTRHPGQGRGVRAIDYQTLIRVASRPSAAGEGSPAPLFGGDKPRLVSIEGIPRNRAGPQCLVCAQPDKPGYGALGNALSAAAVNIATTSISAHRSAAGDRSRRGRPN
jgi:hypothetical protein